MNYYGCRILIHRIIGVLVNHLKYLTWTGFYARATGIALVGVDGDKIVS